MDSPTERERIALEHIGIIDKLLEITKAYKPTAKLNLVAAIGKLVNDVRDTPTLELTELLDKARDEHKDLIDKIPECTCDSCMRKAGIEDPNVGHITYVKFLSDVRNILDTANTHGISNVLGYQIIAVIAKDGEGRSSYSNMSGDTPETLEMLAGIACVDFFIEYESVDGDDNISEMVLDVAIARAKKGSKWKSNKAKEKLKSMLMNRGAGEMPSGLAELLRGTRSLDPSALAKAGVMEIKGSNIEEITKNLKENLEKMGAPPGPPDESPDK
jgi:hypothetical protein